jgi:hypothetical protein
MSDDDLDAELSAIIDGVAALGIEPIPEVGEASPRVAEMLQRLVMAATTGSRIISISLHTGEPTAQDLKEVDYAGYARQDSGQMVIRQDGSVVNEKQIAFPAMTRDVHLAGIGLFGDDGTLLGYTQVAFRGFVGCVPTLEPGQLQFVFH